jgi:glycosyltransferase involved in cell wall biosynthesis
MKICIIDTIGLTYDGETLTKRGLGGSESAVILMAKELAKLDFDITVFNNCEDNDCSPGTYDNVTYLPLHSLKQNKYTFDIAISSRTIIPFVPNFYYNLFQPDQYGRMHDCHSFKNITSKYKILWKHDTFCMGDHILEELFINNYIDEMFTLSDFHSTYVTNSNHGKKRNYEVLKNKVFQTRNGIVNYNPEVDIAKKDRNHFVYNASITKGMLPLVNKIWPRIHQKIPKARLTVIGGYYRFRENAKPDDQEVMFHRLVKERENSNQNITFTGIISQKEISEILTNASFFLFPCAFPETFGISTLESLNYNTPLIATRFGALEETAVEQASYFIDYAIEPTPLSPWLNTEDQITEFVNKTIQAYNTPYLHQQKMYYCNNVKDVSTWDTVALQWKQHFYKKFNKYMSLDEYKKVSYINSKVHEVFGRRISNPQEWSTPKQSKEQKIVVISPFYNAEKYLEECILSVATQNYENYEHILINDCSTDNSKKIVLDTIAKLPENISYKFLLVDNTVNQGAVYNQYHHTKNVKGDDTIIMYLDGDDALQNDNSIFDYYNHVYNDNTEFTYGSCWSIADNIPLVAQPYPKDIRDNKKYRQHKFNWGMPYTHLRTFRRKLFNDLKPTDFQDKDGNWFKAGGDNSTFYNVIEQADPNKVKALSKIVYRYNDLNPLNDYKVNAKEQNETANLIRGSQQPLKKILIAIPTAKYIETATFRSIWDLDVPEGYEVDFQYFYGYSRIQKNNLIAEWAKRYDYTLFMKPNVILSSDTIVDIVKSNADVISIDDNLIICASKKVFNKLVQYPHFETNQTERLEIEHFIKKACTQGATHSHLMNKTKMPLEG